MAKQSPGGANLPGRPVPGGTSQKGATRTPLPRGGRGTIAVGQGRGLIGGGTPDKHNRTPAQQARNASGNYGGGYAGVLPGSRRPPGARKRG